MKIYKTLLILLGTVVCTTGALAQHPDGARSEGDTTITVSKETARKILEEYPTAEEVKNDLIPDYFKRWMVTDRPHIAETPILVGKGTLQWETGFQVSNTNTSLGKTKDITYNTMLVRLGLSRRVEARFEMSYLGTKTTKTANDSLKVNTSGFSGLNVASKVFLFDEKGLRPKGTLLYGLSLPFIGSTTYRPENTGGFIKFLFLNEITHHYEFEYNVGVVWSGNTKQASYVYALNNEFMITQKFNAFVEIYGSFTENNGMDNRFNGTFINDHRLNGGFWYLFNKDLQVDVSGGVGLSAASPDYYVALGLSNRFSVSKKKV
ncbi:transporter [Cytophaga aurantiaca]|uniref:transporter n=1 Tax=Cytophaga aurantiaca TaxID=29530 RepID=UPI000367237D|nr:transporter [Cytophaga aurantiaca]